MLLRAFTDADFVALAELDLLVLRREDPAFDALPEREKEGRVRASEPALRFYARSEHSFVAEEGGGLAGAVFAQSVWQGDRPTVLVTRVWVREAGDGAVGAALLRACTKSAYDAAVYEVHLPVTEDLRAPAREVGFKATATYAVLALGSRGETSPGLPL